MDYVNPRISMQLLNPGHVQMGYGNHVKKPINQEIKIKNNTLTYVELLKCGIKELCSNGTLHGLKYITDSSKRIAERIMWGTICVLSVVVCAININSMWLRWVSVPFNLVMDDDYTPIYDIPFPSIIICPENTVKLSYINLTKNSDPVSLFAASMICNNMHNDKYYLPESTMADVDDEIIAFITKSSPSCGDLIKSCRWMAMSDRIEETHDCCSEYFQPFMTNNGICFGFNMVTHLDQNKLDSIINNKSTYIYSTAKGYNYASNIRSAYPRRIFSVGESYGLSVELYLNTSNSQDMCDGSDFGFRILMASPIETAIGKSFARIPMERQTTFSMIPNSVGIESSMKYLTPKLRKCYLTDEKNLKYFKFYTQYNCVLECELKYIIQFCNCIPFYFKSSIPYLPICKTYKKYKCLNKIKARVNMKMMESYYRNKLGDQFKNEDRSSYDDGISWCECYPSCSVISYNMEIFYSDFLKTTESGEPVWANYTTKRNEVTRFDVRFKESLFLGFHREIVYDSMAFVGATGGVMSLFLGFSIMSLIELIYYIVLKPLFIWITLRLNHRYPEQQVMPYIP